MTLAADTVLAAVGGTERAQQTADNAVAATTYYVSQRGSNGDGRSWASAWSELNRINWSVISPGATILIDGGTTSMTYTTTLVVQKSGLPQAPIRIERATESGRNGQIIIDGGRKGALPYCNQQPATWPYATSDTMMRSFGIGLNQRWVVIDGRGWRGIKIHRHSLSGISFQPGAANVTIRNVEITDNGVVKSMTGGNLATDGTGVRLTGDAITLERAIIYDNGQDGVQSSGDNRTNGITNFTVRESWFYNTAHPVFGDKWAKNSHEDNDSCTHADGIQIYNGGPDQYGVRVEDSVFGPRLMQGVILGDTCARCGNTGVSDVLIRNSLFHNATSQQALMHSSSSVPWPNNWRIENSTFHSAGGSNVVIRGGDGHELRDSIFVGGTLSIRGDVLLDNNCQWQVWGSVVGVKIDPLFTAPLGNGNREQADFSARGSSPCLGKGAAITSVQQLLSRPQKLGDGLTRAIFLPAVGIGTSSSLFEP